MEDITIVETDNGAWKINDNGVTVWAHFRANDDSAVTVNREIARFAKMTKIRPTTCTEYSTGVGVTYPIASAVFQYGITNDATGITNETATKRLASFRRTLAR